MLGMNSVPKQSEPPIKTVDSDTAAEFEAAEPASASGNMLTRWLKPGKTGKRTRFAIPRTDLESGEDDEGEELASKDGE
jgi:hypothetical protein